MVGWLTQEWLTHQYYFASANPKSHLKSEPPQNWGDVEFFDRRKIDVVGFALKFDGVGLVEEIRAVFNHVVQNKKPVGFGQETYLALGEGVNLVVFFQKPTKPLFGHRANVVRKHRAVACIGANPAKKVKVTR